MVAISKPELLSRILGLAFGVTLVVGYFVSLRNGLPTQGGSRFDEEPGKEQGKSDDLAGDIKRMWKTVPHGKFPVSPVSAINAASRVFATVDLIGKTTNEVFAAIGHNETSNDSGYNFPFWPVETNALVYRFDCGHFGWQFNLKLDASGTVKEVETKWIH